MSTVDLKKKVTFDKSIIISEKESLTQQSNDSTGAQGQIRFNKETLKFEGYHSQPNSDAGADIFNNKWRPFTQDVASASNLGIIRVGANLTIQESTGILSSIAQGIGRFYQNVITVSPIVGAGEYLTINQAITNAIGTPGESYLNGVLTGILKSPPSTIYPFVILVAPGNYTEELNQIILPDYVSIRGDHNYNTIITQNSGSTLLEDCSMIYAGHNSEIKDIVIKLADSQTTLNSVGIYSKDKSNVVIDNCIINSTTNSTTTNDTYGIYMSGGVNNKITNNKITNNSSTITGNLNAIYLNNTTPQLLNNNIDILTSNTTVNNGIYINNCIGSSSIKDKLYIDGLNLSNNYFTSNAGSTNTGIDINNSYLVIKNSDIEVSNNLINTNNYGIKLNSEGNIAPYLSKTTTNIISFTNTEAGVNTITSSDSSAFNFITENYDRGQYISVSGSTLNDGIYKISNTLTSTVLTLDTGYNLFTEIASASNNITLHQLYDINIYNTTINGSSNTIKNSDTNSNYICNLNNVITNGGVSNIEPSTVVYNNYKTIIVSKKNGNFNSLYNAMNSITDNSSNNRYSIKIQSGIYHETAAIICKEYVDIEGNGEDNTILQFYQYDNTSGVPNNNTTCIGLISNSTIKNLKIQNSNTLSTYTAGQTTSSLLNNITNPITNVVIENISLDATSYSAYNYGIHLNNCTNIIVKNVDIIVNSNAVAIENIGIKLNISTSSTFTNITTTITSSFSISNMSLHLIDSECTINNPNFTTHSGTTNNIGIKTENINDVQKMIQVYNGQIRAYDSVDYSLYGDNYYTIICNCVQILGDIFDENTTSSRLYFNNCYSFTNETDKFNVSLLNNLGENNQINGTISIDETAGKRNATGINNVFIGIKSGSSITSASHNTLVGFKTGLVMTAADNNVCLGSYVGKDITTAQKNTIIGSNAAIAMTSGSENIIAGYNATAVITTGNKNIIMGSTTGSSLSTGNLNVFIGHNSAINTTSASRNIFLGGSIGLTNQTGNDNTYIGYNTGNNSITSNNTILIGKNTGYTNLSSNIVAVGNEAGYNTLNSTKSTYIGHNSGYNSTGECNTYIGHKSGYSTPSSSGEFNIAIGNESGYSLTSGSRNVLIGSTRSVNGTSNDSAGWLLNTGSDNIYIGSNTGAKSTISTNNVIIGSDVGTELTTSSNSILIGKNTGNNLTTNGNSIIIGSESGNNNTNTNTLIIGQNSGDGYSGENAFTIGHSAGKNVQGINNMFIGNHSGSSVTSKSGVFNLALGHYTGSNLVEGSRNIIVGSGSSILSTGRQISSGNDNTLLGYNTGSSIQAGTGNTLIGSNTGASISSGSHNIGLGYESAFTLGTGINNVCIGKETGYKLEGGSNNILSGTQAGYNIISGANNINIGNQAGFQATTAEHTINLGYQSGYSSTADNNVFIGNQAGLNNTSGLENIFIGKQAGKGASSNGNYNVFMGCESGNQNVSGDNNVFLGYISGYQNTTGDKNIYIGNQTAKHNRGSNNIFIGNEVEEIVGTSRDATDTLTTLGSRFAIYNTINISGITEDTTSDCTILLGGNLTTGMVGIGTLKPENIGTISKTATKLVVVGSVKANSYTPFTGSHIITIDNSINIDTIKSGMIMSATGTSDYKDINNSIIMCKPSVVTTDKTVYGVYSFNETIVNSNSNIAATTYYVNSLGEGGILVTNFNGEIQNGDYITSCPITGHGALQADDILHSYTVAKCTQMIDWSTITTTITHNATTYKYYYTSCTYHCG